MQDCPSYIKSNTNKAADFETRKIKQNLKWLILEHLFSEKTYHFQCILTIRLFASRVNESIDKTDSFGFDTFSYSWKMHYSMHTPILYYSKRS